MIVIQVKLASVSLFSLVALLINVCPVVLGLLLATHDFDDIKSLQIPSALTAASSILCILTHVVGIIWTYKLLAIAACIISSTVMAGSGLYFIGQYIHKVDVITSTINNRPYKLEMAFVFLWLISLLINIAISFFSLGAVYLSMCGPENDVQGFGSPQVTENDYMFEKPEITDAVDTPAAHMPYQLQQAPQLSPHLSWPSSIGSIHSFESFGLGGTNPNLHSMNGGGLTDRQQQDYLHNMPSQASFSQRATIESQPHKMNNLATPGLGGPVLSASDNQFTSPGTPHDNHSPGGSPKAPKSPLKIHLSRSSFSLRRTGSKASVGAKKSATNLRNNTSGANANMNTNSSHYKSPGSMAYNTLHSDNTMALGDPLAVSTADSNTPRNWIIVPNENPAESRSVSGSSQLTGKIFPAAEYNRKLNSAGFERDEPVPVHVEVVQNRPVLSQYDLEQKHRKRAN